MNFSKEDIMDKVNDVYNNKPVYYGSLVGLGFLTLTSVSIIPSVVIGGVVWYYAKTK